MADHQKQKNKNMKKASVIFSAEDLTAGYRSGSKENILFNKINLSMAAGQLVCMMGPNGSGKSTLIRSLAGLQPILGGRLSHSDKKHVAVVLTDKVNSPHMTVEELIAFGRYPHQDWMITQAQNDKEIIEKVIAQVGINHLVKRKLYELSDGQMQMAMIGRALVQQTPVLLLDEPTAHLDLNNRLGIMNLLRKLAREEDKAILVSTHELDLALQTADIVWLTSGAKIKQGMPEDLVLDGSFDDVFKFKGFDLKTGRVEHVAFRNKTVGLHGSGPELLWTKNALERNGFEVSDRASTSLHVREKNWLIDGRSFGTIAEVIDFLIFQQDI
jgi:iron complex transport system ATP-binding protein